MDQDSQFLCIGKVQKPHALKGQIWVSLYNRQSSILTEIKQLYIKNSGDVLTPLTIMQVSTSGERFLLRLQEVSNRTTAESLQGVELYAKRTDLPVLDEQEFYTQDLVGCEVLLKDTTQSLGRIVAVQVLGIYDHLLLDGHAEQHFIPLLPGVLYRVDLDKKTVEIDPPEGLLELANL